MIKAAVMNDMKFDFEGSYPKMPVMTLRERLGWEYFFGPHPTWACIRTGDGVWIVTDEACDLDNAIVYPDDDAFTAWLDQTAKENLEEDPVGFFSQFVKVEGLVTEETAQAMKEAVLEDLRDRGYAAD